MGRRGIFAFCHLGMWALLSILTYSRLNWKEDLFLFFLLCLYGAARVLKWGTSSLWNRLLIFVLVFLLSQFYINDFHPESLSWWFASVPGYITMLVAFAGVTLLIHEQRSARNEGIVSSRIQAFAESLGLLANRAAVGIVVVSVAMFFLLILNIDEISPERKVSPDYSMYVIIAFGFILFYSLDLSLRHVSPKTTRIFLSFVAPGALIFLVSVGAMKIHRVWAAYRIALGTEEIAPEISLRSRKKLWEQVLVYNQIPRIKWMDIKATVELGKMEVEEGNLVRAAGYYEKVLADRTFNFEANLGLAKMAFSERKWRKAWEAYKKVVYLRLQDNDLFPYYVHASIKAGRIDKAIEFVTDFGQNHPIDLYASEDYLAIGEAFLRNKSLTKALGYLRKGKEAMPKNYEAYFLLGKAYLESRQYSQASEALQNAMQLNQGLIEGYYYLGIAYEGIHQDEKAVEILEKLVSIDTRNIRALSLLERLYRKIGMEDRVTQVNETIEGLASKVVEAREWHGTSRSGASIYRNGNMYSTGTVSSRVLLKGGNVRFIVQAKGTPAKGIWPHMVVRLDNQILGEVDVTSENMREYEFKRKVQPGEYQLSITYTNNYGVWDKNGKPIEDRNLFVRRCRILYEE